MVEFLLDLGVSDFAHGLPSLTSWVSRQFGHVLVGTVSWLAWLRWPQWWRLLVLAIPTGWVVKELLSDMPRADWALPVVLDSISDLAFGALGAGLTWRWCRRRFSAPEETVSAKPKIGGGE